MMGCSLISTPSEKLRKVNIHISYILSGNISWLYLYGEFYAWNICHGAFSERLFEYIISWLEDSPRKRERIERELKSKNMVSHYAAIEERFTECNLTRLMTGHLLRYITVRKRRWFARYCFQIQACHDISYCREEADARRTEDAVVY